jgi:glycosyltransferase involved in cell wall biosynthesis
MSELGSTSAALAGGPAADAQPRAHIAVFLYGLTSGGAPRRALALADEFARRGHRVDVVVTRADGPLRSRVPGSVRLVELRSVAARVPLLSEWRPFRVRTAVFSLADYLRRERPGVLLSGANSGHFTAVLANRRAGAPARLVLRLCTHLSGTVANGKRPAQPWQKLLARRVYTRADAWVAGSADVARDFADVTGLPLERIATIHNPVVSPEIARRAAEPVAHPWFQPGEPPVVLGVGRIVRQKDFPTLIEAFARLRAERPLRLVILGEAQSAARLRPLEERAARLGVASDVAFPGLVENPYAYMARAAVFVLSSAWEGLSGVLVEAMACGCPVVATDCPGGSAETLDGGRYGPLVPVSDPAALAAAIRTVLDGPRDPERLRRRASEFDVASSVDRYLRLLLGPA